MTIIQRTDTDGIAILTWDDPSGPVNTKSYAALDELDAHLSAIRSDPAIRGAVIISGKDGFLAGANLNELLKMQSEADAASILGRVRTLLRTLETGGKPVVAAIGGAAFGGGMELAMACHARVVTAAARFSLPELSLGLMPGAGGTQRLPRLVGLAQALPMLLEGRVIGGEDAKAIGLADAAATPETLLAEALRLAQSAQAAQPWDRDTFAPEPAPGTPEADALFAEAEARCAKRSNEADIAEAALLGAIRTGYGQPIDDALETELAAFARLAVSTQARNLIRTMFFGVPGLRKMPQRPKDQPPFAIRKAAVLGAGLMGGGIALTIALNGVPVVLIDVAEAPLERGVAAIDRALERQVKRGRLTPETRDMVRARITPQVGILDLGDCDALVEAVPEVPAIKAQVLSAASAQLPQHAFIASNTSTMPIDGLADHCTAPDRFIGLHYFSPVEIMPLLEVVKGPRTSAATLAKALDLAKLMRKTPIVVNDGLGFFTSRVVGTYTGEALTLLAEGVDPALIDTTARRFGMPIGPIAMADTVGLPLLKDIYASLRGDGNRIANAGARSEEVLAKLVEAGRKGRDGGVYDYVDGKPQPWPGLADLFPRADPQPDAATVRNRMFHAQSLEAARALEEGIVANPTEADVGSVLGWAFPKVQGGVLSYADGIGLARFVTECDALAETCGGRFGAPQLMRDMAREGRRFHAG